MGQRHRCRGRGSTVSPVLPPPVQPLLAPSPGPAFLSQCRPQEDVLDLCTPPCFASCVSCVSHCWDRIPEKINSKAARLAWLVRGKAWWQGCEVADHVTSVVRKQSACLGTAFSWCSLVICILPLPPPPTSPSSLTHSFFLIGFPLLSVSYLEPVTVIL